MHTHNTMQNVLPACMSMQKWFCLVNQGVDKGKGHLCPNKEYEQAILKDDPQYPRWFEKPVAFF